MNGEFLGLVAKFREESQTWESPQKKRKQKVVRCIARGIADCNGLPFSDG